MIPRTNCQTSQKCLPNNMPIAQLNKIRADNHNRELAPEHITQSRPQGRPLSTLDTDRMYYSNQPSRHRQWLHEPTKLPNSRNQEEVEEIDEFLDEENIPKRELKILRTLADNLVEDWPQRRSRTICHTLSDIATYTTHMAKRAMICYFTDQPPFL